MRDPYVYDKAKYHYDLVEQYGLPEEQASIHTAFFLGWLLERGFLSDEFLNENQDQIAAFKRREMTAVEVYEFWDRCLVDDMLNDTGNQFAQDYFDFDQGSYLKDYAELLAKDLPSEYHVLYTWENQALMSALIEQRYQSWRQERGAPPSA